MACGINNSQVSGIEKWTVVGPSYSTRGHREASRFRRTLELSEAVDYGTVGDSPKAHPWIVTMVDIPIQLRGYSLISSSAPSDATGMPQPDQSSPMASAALQ